MRGRNGISFGFFELVDREIDILYLYDDIRRDVVDVLLENVGVLVELVFVSIS